MTFQVSCVKTFSLFNSILMEIQARHDLPEDEKGSMRRLKDLIHPPAIGATEGTSTPSSDSGQQACRRRFNRGFPDLIVPSRLMPALGEFVESRLTTVG